MSEFRAPAGWKFIGTNMGGERYGDTSKANKVKEGKTIRKLQKMKPPTFEVLLKEKDKIEKEAAARKEWEKKKKKKSKTA